MFILYQAKGPHTTISIRSIESSMNPNPEKNENIKQTGRMVAATDFVRIDSGVRRKSNQATARGVVFSHAQSSSCKVEANLGSFLLP